MEQKQTQTPLKCPRCNSLNTKFRYFNNNNRAQPRHYCRTCKRPWTAGGNLRDIPIGGKPRGRQTRASSSRFGSRFLLPQRPLISGEQLQNPQHTSPNVAMVPRICDPNKTQSVLNQPVPISPLGDYYLNDDISCLDAIQSLIEPEVWNQPVSDGNQFGNGTADLAFMQDWAIQPMTTPQVLPQEIPGQIETYQVPDQANVEAAYSLTNHSLVPNWPMNSFLQEDFNDFDFPISDPCLWNNSSGSVIVTDTTTTSDNPNQWPNFPVYGPP